MKWVLLDEDMVELPATGNTDGSETYFQRTVNLFLAMLALFLLEADAFRIRIQECTEQLEAPNIF